jgi:hypothetical protein
MRERQKRLKTKEIKGDKDRRWERNTEVSKEKKTRNKDR